MQPLPLTLMRLPHISSISFMISGVAPCASCPVRNPVLVLTKSALACIAHSQAFLTSSTVRASYTVSNNRGCHEQGFSGIALELYVYALRGGGIFLPLTLTIFRQHAVGSHCAILSMTISTAVAVIAAIVDSPVPPLFIGLGTSFLFLAAGYITHHGEAGLSAR